MEGVILFADDKVFEANTSENKLYLKLASEFPVLAVNTIDLASKAIKSIGTFSAIILDWEFQEIFEGIKSVKNPTVILDKSDFYSLVYVFSNITISQNLKTKYKKKFESRISFNRKNSNGTISKIAYNNFRKIKSNISSWQTRNKSQVVTLNWSNSVNQSVQHIFSDLNKASNNWIFELHKSAANDFNPEMEVVNMFQSLLSEKLSTKRILLDSINNLVTTTTPIAGNALAVGKLFQRIYFTNLLQFNLTDVPIMTGDIFLLNNKTKRFGIIVTPECDIKKVISNRNYTYQLITFNKSDFDSYVIKNFKSGNATGVLNANNKPKLKSAFNQPTEQRLFILPSFPYSTNVCDKAAILDFSNPITYLTNIKILSKHRVCRLNSPYLQQLRQRYLSYIGRVGVPAVPDGLKELNISHY